MGRFTALMVFSACFGINLGCSDRGADMPQLGSVHGTITLDGSPLPGVGIYFKPTTGRQSIATSDESGLYNATYLVDEEGVKVGPCVVTVAWDPEEPGAAIPPRYGAMSELKLDVKSGDNEFNIDMTSK